nr:transcriptional regulator prz1 [Quercus suber]
MVSGLDPMGSQSLTSRRPHASNLPNFELPPPPLSAYQKYNNYFNPQPTATTLTSVGNLLTPPSNSSADGIGPGSSMTNTMSQQGGVASFTPNNGGMWPPQNLNTTNSYGYQSSANSHSFGPGRPIFSPSLNSIVRSPTHGELSQSSYDMSGYSGSSMSMSGTSLPPVLSHQHMPMIGNHTPGTAPQSSPINTQDAFARPPPTPSYYSGSQPSSTPHQATFPSYSTGPSPVQQSPISAGGSLSKMSPINGHGASPSIHTQQQQYSTQQRQFTYPTPGPVLSNVNNPNGQLALVGGMQQGMMPGYNSGHAAHLQHMYGPPQQAAPQNDRPFRCDQCPQSFNRNHDLKRHKRIHLAVKPFPCGHCDKSFSRKDALKRHVLVKGCGKAQASAEIKELDGSLSPISKAESLDQSPIITASA